MQQQPIGIFDSGVGGTSIWKEIHALLPNENTIYLADSANAPYGEKTAAKITALSIKNTQMLIEMGCKIIVVACNTATTNAIDVLRQRFDIPVIGIEPAIKPAALQTKSKNIGILATKGTLSSALFHATTQEFTQDISIVEVIGTGLVRLIEAGHLHHPKTIELLEKYMAPMVAANIDHLVLGCSHYPYLMEQLQQILPKHITIIDSGLAVAKQTASVLKKNGLLSSTTEKPLLQFYSNGRTATISFLLSEYAQHISVEKKQF